MAKEFSYEIIPDFDFIIEEGQNNSTNLRKISWNGREPKLDIRKCYPSLDQNILKAKITKMFKDKNLVELLFGKESFLTNFVYALVGISGLVSVGILLKPFDEHHE